MKYEEIKKAVKGQEVIFDALIKSFTTKETKTSQPFVMGTLHAGGDIPFKIWSGACLDSFIKMVKEGDILNITATVDDYGGVFSLILVDFMESSKTKEEVVSTPYNMDSYWLSLDKLLKSELSIDAYAFWSVFMEDKKGRFTKEVASTRFHDNVYGGLMAHTFKMASMLKVILKVYKSIYESLDTDLLYLGVALHDIGKIEEYNDCVQSDIYFADHKALGLLMLSPFKDRLIEERGEEWFYRLVSIITQHHGEYGERPRTIEAMLIHFIDMFESELTSINQELPLEDKTKIGNFVVK